MNESRSSQMYVFVGGANAGKHLHVESDRQAVQLQVPKDIQASILEFNSSHPVNPKMFFEIEMYTKRTWCIDVDYISFFAHDSLNDLAAFIALLNGYKRP